MTEDQQPCQPVDASDVAGDVAATQAFLSWARQQGYSFDTVTIGRVQLIGTRDLLPNIAVQVRARELADRRDHGGADDSTPYSQMPGAEHFDGARPG